MKVVLISLLFCAQAQALTLEIIGKRGASLLKTNQQISLPTNVGQVSFQILQENKIPFHGGSYGFDSIFNLGQDIKAISDVEMKAYGWCFSIDGFVPETMADKTPMPDTNSSIIWFYAYAHYKDGRWIAQCHKDDF